MNTDSRSTTDHMRRLIDTWRRTADRRAIFLDCYSRMTANMLLALEQGAFQDAAWVEELLHRFAGYYFDALTCYEQDGASAPLVWQIVHDTTRQTGVHALQHLLLGVNAHINYDLVLTLVDLLDHEWTSHSEAMRALRFADHCHVNRVIARTIDAVQDDVLEPCDPALDHVDRWLGRLDEWLIARLIARWRHEVWHNAAAILGAAAGAERAALRRQVETTTLQRARAILLAGTVADLRCLV